jgi:hypothetical protein
MPVGQSVPPALPTAYRTPNASGDLNSGAAAEAAQRALRVPRARIEPRRRAKRLHDIYVSTSVCYARVRVGMHAHTPCLSVDL